MTIRYKYSDGTTKEFEDRESFFNWVERMDSGLARNLRFFGVEFSVSFDAVDMLIKAVADGEYEHVTQRELLDRGLDALSEDLYNGREEDDWLFEKLMMERDD